MNAILLALVASVLGAVAMDMCKDEARTRLGRFPLWLIQLAAKRIPESDRADLKDEWDAELTFILRDTEGLPVTRLIRGIAYSADLLFRGAPRVTREIRAEAAAVSDQGGAGEKAWASLFPEGRHIYYEGDDHTAFVRRIKAEYSFNPAADPHWGQHFGVDAEGDGWGSYSFHCPAEHLDAIYGNPDFPMGS
jgi:hypothetical protein